ncbi:MAG: acyl-CoA dehydrogenase family protein [Frankia sp.]
MTDLLYSEIEDELRAGTRAMLADRARWNAVLEHAREGRAPYDPELWRVLATEMGLAGLIVPESLGGAGASLREAAVVCEELGRVVAPVPFLGSAVVATATVLAAAGDDPSGPVAELLTALAAGERTAALVVPFSTIPFTATLPAATRSAPNPAAGAVGATGPGPYPVFSVADGALTGSARNVADAIGADVLLVPATDGLYAVPGDAGGVTRDAVVSLDITRPITDVTLDRATGTLLAAGAHGAEATRVGLGAGAALLASEQLGIAEACLEQTVAYLKGRYQFGRPIGSFQGLKHRAADLWVSITQARAAARHAAVCVATGDPDAVVATAIAQAHCSLVAVKAAEENVQMHGGIGFTWEHPAHLYLKRAKVTAIAFGTPDRHLLALAELLHLPTAG